MAEQPEATRPTRSPKGLMVERSSRHHIPLTTILELTHRCNEKCIHCYVVQPTGKPDTELTTKEWKDVLSQLASEGTMEVTFTGGEPLWRSDFFDILNEARQLNFAIKLSTNATLIGPSEAAALGKLKLWEIGVSLYGASAEVHDAITTIPGSFGKTVKGIKLLREQGLRVKIRSVLMKENVSSDDKLERLAADLGAGFAQDPLLTPQSSGSHENLVHRIDKEQLRSSLEREVRRLFGNFDPQKWEAVRIDKLQSSMCKAGINFCCIDPYGKVLPCVQFQLVAGDLKRQTFHEIWRSSPLFGKLRQTTNKDLEKCPDCRLLPVCFRCPGEALLVDGDAFGPSSWACLRSELMDEIYNEIKDSL